MSAKASKEVIDRVRSGRHLLSAYEVEGPRLAASFVDETRDHLEEGDEEPRPDSVLVAVERKLRGSMDHLVGTDYAVAEAEGWESVLRKQFKEDKRQLAFCLVAFRRLVLAQYEEPDLPNLALEPVNVRDGITIVRRGELVDERFAAENLAKMLGKSRFEQPVDLAPYVAEIRKKSAALLALSDEINEAHRASDRARLARSRAKEVFDRVYLRAARIFEDLCRFAGLDDLAARIRRREGRATPPAETTPDAPEKRVTHSMPSKDSLRLEDIEKSPEFFEEENRDGERTRDRRIEDVPSGADPAGADTADLQAVHVRAPAEVPDPGRGRPGGGGPQPPPAHPDLLSRLLRPLRRQLPGVRPDGVGAPGDRDRPGADRRPPDRGERRPAPGQP